jgi:competence protein ComEA
MGKVRACCGALGIVVGLGAAVPWVFAAESVAAPRAQTAVKAQPIDINAATAADLVSVPGIGEAMAKRIVEFREETGPFQRLEDLLKIKGIGEKSFERRRPYLTVGGKR